MNVVINAVFMHEYARGVGRVSNNIICKLAEIDSENHYYIYYGSWQKYDFLKVKKDNFHFVPLYIPRNALMRNMYLSFVLPFRILKHKPNLYHIMDTSPIFVKTCPTISTIHDLAEFTVPEKYNGIKCFFRKKYVKLQAKKSDQIVTVSNYTKDDIVRRFNVDERKVKVVYNFFEPDRHFNLKRKTENYFLVVGEIERTKNVGCVVEAFSHLPQKDKDRFKVYIVGRKGNDYENVIRIIRECNVADNVKIFDYVSDEKLFSIYENAYALVFASLFEGFGLPVLEAMSFGIPVISSNASSMPEVAGNAELLFDPLDCDELTHCMKKIIDSPDYRVEMMSAGFEQIKKFDSAGIMRQLQEIYALFR